MDKTGHVLNALLLGVGVGIVLAPAGDLSTVRTVAAVFVPLVLGALVPDVDTAVGEHRKTAHYLPVLGVFLAYPVYFGNLRYVWLGILAHYVLDVVGSTRGIALFYPLSDREFGFPTGVTTASQYAEVVTLVVTALELAVAALLVHVAPGVVEAGLSGLPFDPGLDGLRTRP